MNYSYKEGYREGVVFVFVDKDAVLIEDRKGDGSDIFFPNGSIEIKDHITGKDYKEVCLLREVAEEFDGKVKLVEYSFLCETKAEAIGVVFYTFLVTKWEGTIPEYTVEEGENSGALSWVPLNNYRNFFKYDSAIKICEALLRAEIR